MINYPLTHLPVAQEDTPILLSPLVQLDFTREQQARTHTHNTHTTLSLSRLDTLYIETCTGLNQQIFILFYFFYIRI